MLPKRLVYISPKRNSFKFYCLEFSPSMFGDVGLLLTHGRLGQSENKTLRHFESESQALDYAREIIFRKIRKGYIEALGEEWTLPLASILRQTQLTQERLADCEREVEFDQDQLDLFIKYDPPRALESQGNVVRLESARARELRGRLGEFRSIAITDCLLDDRKMSKIADRVFQQGIQSLDQLNSISDAGLAKAADLSLIEAAEFRRCVWFFARKMLRSCDVIKLARKI